MVGNSGDPNPAERRRGRLSEFRVPKWLLPYRVRSLFHGSLLCPLERAKPCSPNLDHLKHRPMTEVNRLPPPSTDPKNDLKLSIFTDGSKIGGGGIGYGIYIPAFEPRQPWRPPKECPRIIYIAELMAILHVTMLIPSHPLTEVSRKTTLSKLEATLKNAIDPNINLHINDISRNQKWPFRSPPPANVLHPSHDIPKYRLHIHSCWPHSKTDKN